MHRVLVRTWIEGDNCFAGHSRTFMIYHCPNHYLIAFSPAEINCLNIYPKFKHAAPPISCLNLLLVFRLLRSSVLRHVAAAHQTQTVWKFWNLKRTNLNQTKVENLSTKSSEGIFNSSILCCLVTTRTESVVIIHSIFNFSRKAYLS